MQNASDQEEGTTSHWSRNRTRVFGIDFSGARDAGKKIWVVFGIIEEDTLRIDECCQARDLPGLAKGLE